MRVRRMTTRKLFAGVTLVALAGVAIFGGVFAWRTADSARGAALVGANQFEITYEAICNAANESAVIDPDTGDVLPCLTLIGHNGETTPVGEGKGTNNGDFDLVVIGGRLEVRHLLPPIDPLPLDEVAEDLGEEELQRPCTLEDFSGEVVVENPGEVIPPGGTGGAFTASLTVDDGAPRSCQGHIVIYKVIVVAENPDGDGVSGEAAS